MTLEEYTNYGDVKYWLWVSINQVYRFRQSFNDGLSAMESFEPSLGHSLRHQYANARTSGDMHFLLIATHNLVKASSKRLLPDRIKINRLKNETAEKIEHLRNIHEHWEKTRAAFTNNLGKNKSSAWYEGKYPDRTPWSLSYDARGLVVCGILSVDELEAELIKLGEVAQEIGR